MEFIDLSAQQRRLRPALDAALARVLDHGRYVMGPEVTELEDALSAVAGGAGVLSCASGTDALLLALMARRAGPGDAVFVPSFTFCATAEAVALVGATPVFVDVEQAGFNLDPNRLADAVAGLDGGLRPVGIIAVDLFGQPAPYPAIAQVASRHGLWVVADAAQSFGASAAGVPVGSMAPLTTTSFFPAKPLGCYGDGGAVAFTSPDDAEVLRSLRVHGAGTDKYDTVRIGINGRLDTVQAAVLLQKLTVFREELRSRQRVADRYAAGLADSVTVPTVPDGVTSSWAQYTVRVPDRDRVAAELGAQGIPTAIYYRKPLHRHEAYRWFPVGRGGLAVTERLAGEVLSLPMHPYLGEDDQDRVVEAVRAAVGAASRA